MKRYNKSNDSFEDFDNVNDIQKRAGDDPLKHNVKLSKWQWIRTFIFSITVFPVRVVTFLILLIYRILNHPPPQALVLQQSSIKHCN